jgi:hypothetical protein
MRADCVAFADHWEAHNEKVLRATEPGPLWVVLGDSTAQGGYRDWTRALLAVL